MERPLDYVKIVGIGVDAWDRRKERGSLKEITERGLRASIDRSMGRISAAMKRLIAAYPRRSPPV